MANATQWPSPCRIGEGIALLKLDLAEWLRRFQDDWARPARHDEYNAYSVFTMFRHLALHDFHHAYRIEELLFRKDWPAPSPV